TGACYSAASSLGKIDPRTIPDDNIIWTFHSYDPFLLTHQGATWAGDFIPYVTGLPYPLTAVPKGQLDVTLDTIRARIKAEAPWTRQSGLLAYLDEQVASMDSP
ncbi:glycosyl hydrolase, partial [Mesorhizobium sp. M2D.F.Ca.ET.145.01.1.1]